ncbi:unnamed protein product [Alternaria alternata]
MSTSTSLPSNNEIAAFFANDQSCERFIKFLEVFLYSVPVTRRACAIIFEAAHYVNKSTLPSPVSEFLTSKELKAHLNYPVRNRHPEDSFIDTQSTPRPSQPTFK